MNEKKTILLPAEAPQTISTAAEILRNGGLVALPTETVYGLGADGLNKTAVLRIFEAKGRPQDNPLILHVAEAGQLDEICRDIPQQARLLADRLWPGPLTMVLPCTDRVPQQTTAGLPTVAVRCPDCTITRQIILAAGIPIAAPSANLSGRPSCTTAVHVLEDMAGRIDAVVDGGPCTVGVESTIIDLSQEKPRLLRPGGMPLETIRDLIGPIEADAALYRQLKDGEVPKAPGMKYRHYAPRAPVTVVQGGAQASAALILQRMQPTDGVLCFSECRSSFGGAVVRILGPEHDFEAQARRVFDALRSFDDTDVTAIWAQCPPEKGLGRAVANRLNKAAGFHILRAEEET